MSFIYIRARCAAQNAEIFAVLFDALVKTVAFTRF